MAGLHARKFPLFLPLWVALPLSDWSLGMAKLKFIVAPRRQKKESDISSGHHEKYSLFSVKFSFCVTIPPPQLSKEALSGEQQRGFFIN